MKMCGREYFSAAWQELHGGSGCCHYVCVRGGPAAEAQGASARGARRRRARCGAGAAQVAV